MENFVTVLDDDKVRLSGRNARRLALPGGAVDHTLRDNHMDVQKVRSFIVCQCDCDEGLPFQGSEFLRVLRLNSCFLRLGRLEHLERLLHLRCLVLRGTYFHALPEEIGDLKFLQVLYLDSAGGGIRELLGALAC